MQRHLAYRNFVGAAGMTREGMMDICTWTVTGKELCLGLQTGTKVSGYWGYLKRDGHLHMESDRLGAMSWHTNRYTGFWILGVPEKGK